MSSRCFHSPHRISGAELPILPFLAPSVVFTRCSTFTAPIRLLSTTRKQSGDGKTLIRRLVPQTAPNYLLPTTRKQNGDQKIRIDGLVCQGDKKYENSEGLAPSSKVKSRKGLIKRLFERASHSGAPLSKSPTARRMILSKALRERKAGRKQGISRRSRMREIHRRFARERAQGLPRLRPKFIRLSPIRLDKFSMLGQGTIQPEQALGAWTTRFARLSAKFHRRNRPWKAVARLRLRRMMVTSIQLLLSEGSKVEAISNVWVRFGEEKRSRVWKTLMLWALQHSPELALKIIEATHMEPYPPGYAVADSLEYIINHLVATRERSDQQALNNLHRVAHLVLQRGSNPSPTYSQRAIYLLLKHSNMMQAFALFTHPSLRHTMHYNTLLHFVAYFARCGEHEIAFRVVESVFSSSPHLSDLQIMGACSTILRSSAVNGGGYAQSCGFLSRMLKMGLRPNLQLCNVILLNAFEGRAFETGFKIYARIKENGFKPNAHTYSILLKGADLADDNEAMLKAISEVQTCEEAMRNVYVINQTLIYLHRTCPKKHVFPTMLAFYKKNFDIQPLLDLGLQLDQTDQETAPEQREQPASLTLGLLLTAYLSRCSDPDVVLNIYKEFRRQAESGHPLVSPLIENQHCSNAFILAFARQKSTLYMCTKVLGDMLEPLSEEIVNTETGEPVQQATPDVQTWSILAKGFLHNGQGPAAEKILIMMRNRGMKPDQVTWNTLVSGYSRMQDIDAAMNAMKRMELEGYKVDDYTIKGLGNIRNHQKLARAFERFEAEMRSETSSGTEDVGHEEMALGL